jgi:hypothetical protein
MSEFVKLLLSDELITQILKFDSIWVSGDFSQFSLKILVPVFNLGMNWDLWLGLHHLLDRRTILLRISYRTRVLA